MGGLNSPTNFNKSMKSLFTISTICVFAAACNENNKSGKETITNRNLPDSTLNEFVDSTNITVTRDTSIIMNETNVRLWNESLMITLTKKEHRADFFEFELKNQGGRWNATISPVAMPDCLFVASQYRTLKQSINLNKLRYEKGDRLNGAIEISVLEKSAMFREPNVPFIDTRKWDTVKINGHLSAIIDQN